MLGKEKLNILMTNYFGIKSIYLGFIDSEFRTDKRLHTAFSLLTAQTPRSCGRTRLRTASPVGDTPERGEWKPPALCSLTVFPSVGRGKAILKIQVLVKAKYCAF